MIRWLSNLLQRALAVKTETTDLANTADRIGSLLEEMILAGVSSFDPDNPYINGQWAIFNDVLYRAVANTLKGESPITHPQKWSIKLVIDPDQVTLSNHLPVSASAVAALLDEIRETYIEGIAPPRATEDLPGIERRATLEETYEGAVDEAYVSPAKLKAYFQKLFENFVYPTLQSVVDKGNIADKPIKTAGYGRTEFTETDVFKGIAVIVETPDGESQFIEMTSAEYLALVMGGLIPTPTLDEVALAGNVTARPIKAGGYVRDDFTNIVNPYGIAAIYDGGPGARFIEMIQKAPLRAWLDLIPVAAEGRAAGKVPVMRVGADGSYEFALADRDTFRDVTRRSNVTDVPILTTGYGRPGITKVPTALTFACWVPNATQTEHYIEGIGVREAIAWLLQHADAQQLFDILLPLLRPGDGQEQQYIVDDFRCMDAPILAPPSSYTVQLENAVSGQSFPHPFMDAASVYPEYWKEEASSNGGVTNVPVFSGIAAVVYPQSLTVDIAADMVPYTGKIKLEYRP